MTDHAQKEHKMTNTKTFGELTREEKLELMTHWIDGGMVEVRYTKKWAVVRPPSWNPMSIYRKAQTKPSVNWDHVSDDFNWLAVGGDGKAYLHGKKPYLDKTYGFWISVSATRTARVLSSYKRGTCDFKESLVMRPGHNGD